MEKIMELVSPKPKGFVLAAVSGGADSVALLALMREFALAGEIRLEAAHFEHGIRGEESREDARFVCELCAAWNIPCHMGAGDVPALAASRRVGLERAARDARYAFLRRVKDERGADCIALAHHLDDQAETVLMHLLRGAGLKGASGMLPRDGNLYRPLLSIPKKALVAYLEHEGIAWREDSTNALCNTPRNILRHQAFPAMNAAYPEAARALGRFAEIAARENSYMDAQTRAFLHAHAEWTPVGLRLDTSDAGVHEAILMRAAHRLTGLDASSCERICALYHAEKEQSVFEDGVYVEKTGHHLYFRQTDGQKRPSGREWALTGEGLYDLGNLGVVTAQPHNEIIRGDEKIVCVSASAVQNAVFRTRRPSDMIRPLGMKGRMSLSDYFINRRVDRPLRDGIVLLARGGDVLWAAGVGVSEDARLHKGERGLRLALSGDIHPWTDDEPAKV